MAEIDTLRPFEFSIAMLDIVQSFHFGDKPWEVEVEKWIKGEPDQDGESVRTALVGSPARTRVWLYANIAGEIVGFGSLGESNWRWPNPKRGSKVRICVIPMVELRTIFQGKPAGTGINKYCYQILRDLTARAKKDGYPLLGLFVNKFNIKAHQLYKNVGFEDFPPCNGDNDRMVVELKSAEESE